MSVNSAFVSLGIFMVLQFNAAICYALSIQHVSHQLGYLDFKLQKQVVVNYAIDEPANVELRIYDDRDILINAISSKGLQKTGLNKLVWKGDDFKGRRVTPEAYKYTLVAVGSTGAVEHDLSDITGGISTSIYQLEWDKKNSRITYKVLKPVRVNIRVGMENNGPLMATLGDWLPRGHGEHHIPWDGYDNSGVFDLKKMDNIQIYAEAFTLSENTILVGPDVNQVTLIEDIDWDKQLRVRKKSRKISMKNHSQQYAENRGDFKVNVVLPAGLKKSKTGAVVVSGIVPVRFSLEDKGNQRIINDRYEPILFIDGKYFVENEVGFFPMTWNLDTTLLTPGEHYLTINLRGYNGHLGTASARIFVQK